jgi:hypothetical protein
MEQDDRAASSRDALISKPNLCRHPLTSNLRYPRVNPGLLYAGGERNDRKPEHRDHVSLVMSCGAAMATDATVLESR